MLDRKVAFYAPGGGTKSFEDGFDLLDVGSSTHDIYDRVHLVTGVDVLGICQTKDPVLTPAELQVASVAIGYAHAQALLERKIVPDYLVGVSSGEFTVAAIANAIELEKAAELANTRGTLQLSQAGGKGGAYLVIHDRNAKAKKLRNKITTELSEFKDSKITGDHTPIRSLVTYLHDDAVAVRNALESTPGVRRVIDLDNIGYPPHIGLLDETERLLGVAIDEIMKDGGIKDSTVQIIATRTARPMKNAKTIARNLRLQTTKPTRLESSVYFVVNRGVVDHYELGPGTSMSNVLEDFDLGENAIIHPVDDFSRPGVMPEKKPKNTLQTA